MRGSAALRTGITPGGALAGPWVRNPLWTAARAVPSLDLRFADNKSLTDATTGQNLVTFTRASSGTYVDSQGVIRTATTNLVTFSEQFDNAAWNKYGASVTANAVASPTGSSNASKLVEDTSAGGHGIYRSATVATGLSYVWSGYFKAAERSIIQLKCQATGNVYLVEINLSTQTATTRSGNGTTTITDVGNGWYRVASIATSTASGTGYWEAILCSAANTASYTGNGTSGLYLWGAQLEASSAVGEYVPTTSTINSAPRFDHNPTTGESLGLLVEEQRTNSIRNNTMVGAVAGTPGTLPTNWSFGGAGTGTLSRTIAVGESAGISWVDVRFFGTTSTTGFILAFEPSTQIAALTGQSWASSFYLALVSGSIANINTLRHDIVERASAGGTVVQNFSADFKSALTSTLTRSTYAVSLSGGATTAFVQPSIEFSFAAGVAIDITLRIGMPQLEQGAFPTSVIPTTTAAATRSADVASITGSNFSSWYSQSEGTVNVETISTATTVPAYPVCFEVSDGGSNNWIGLSTNSFFNARVGMRAGGAAQIDLYAGTTVAGLPANTLTKYNLAYSLNNSAASRNGEIPSTDSTCVMPSGITQARIGGSVWLSQWNGTIRRLVYWGQRLPNNVLQTITQ